MPLDYQTPDPHDPKRVARSVLRVLGIILGTIFLLILVLLGTCALMMRR
jgi:threonine/homoserine/homoserine lactone efflux protein